MSALWDVVSSSCVRDVIGGVIGEIMGALLEGCEDVCKGVIKQLLDLYEEIGVGVLWEHRESVVGTLSKSCKSVGKGLCHLAGVV